MIANSSNLEPEEEPQEIGGQPVVDPRTGGKDMRLLRRAIREDWPITPEIRRLIVNQMALTAGRSEDERNRIAAAKVLVAADSINARREATDMQAEKLPPAVAVGVQVNVNEEAALNDPRYLEWLRQCALQSQGYASTIRDCGESGTLEHRPALGDPGSSLN